MNLENSETAKNLMRAFAGESQARNRYTFSAGRAEAQGLPVIREVFLLTAGQEKEHGEIFYNHLRELSGQNIMIDAGYPADVYEDTLDLLKAARHNEYEEYQSIYRDFGNVAKSEGFLQAANSFFMISEIERIHGERFQLFADFMEKKQLFVSEIETGWMCLNCGYIYEGVRAPKECPVCHHEQGYFIRMELAPYVRQMKVEKAER